MRLAAHADVGYVRGADQAFYRVHGNNMSTTDFGGQLDDLRQRLVAFDSVLDKCGDLLPQADALSLAARTRLARYALRRAYRAYDRGRTDVVPVDELVGFAAQCLPGYAELGEHRALLRRRRVGARAMPYLQPLVLSAVADRGREWLWWKSWERRGI